jgi:hypothetical protein
MVQLESGERARLILMRQLSWKTWKEGGKIQTTRVPLEGEIQH